MEKEKLKYKLQLQLFGDSEEEEEKQEEDDLEDEDFEDEVDGQEDPDKEGEDTPEERSKKKKQSMEERARQAEIRRQKEQVERTKREEQIRKDAYEKGKLDSTKINTFTNEPINDIYDLKIYELQKKIKDNGGDPIEDLPKELAKIERDEEAKKNSQAEDEQKAQKNINDDIADFKAKHPDVDAIKLMQDGLFKKFSEGKLGKVKLSQIYEEYLDLQEKIISRKMEEENQKKKDEEAKKKGFSPGSNGGGHKETTPYSELSPEQKIILLREEGLIN